MTGAFQQSRSTALFHNILQDIFGVKPLDVNAIKPHSPSPVVQRVAEAKDASSAIPTGVKETVQQAKAKGKAGRPSKSVTEARITPDTPAERQAKIEDAIRRRVTPAYAGNITSCCLESNGF